MKKRILLCLLCFSAIGMAGCVKYNGVPQVKEEESSAIKLTLSTSSMDLKVGDGGNTFTAELTSEEVEIEDKTVLISSDKTDIAIVDLAEAEAGTQVRVKGLAAGSAKITVTSKQDSTANAVLDVKVTAGDGTYAVESVTVGESTVNLKEGETSQITWAVHPDNATVKDVEFKSSDATIATVSNTGLITGVKEGTAKIRVTAKSGGQYAEVTVNVSKDQTLVVDAYYLMGSSSSFGWETPLKSHELVLNEGGGSGHEYMITFNASANDLFKVVQYKGPNTLVWFDIYEFGVDGHSGATNGCATAEGGNIKIVADGKYTLYFDLDVKDSDTCVKYWVAPALN